MRTAALSVLLVLGSVSAGHCGTPTGQVAGFAALKEGGEMEARLVWLTCLGDHRVHEFIFRGSTNAPGVTASAFALQGAQVMPGATNEAALVSGITNRLPLGSLTLTEADLTRLDEMLAFYRRRLPRCTTGWQSVLFKQRHEGQIVAQEDFCAVADYMVYADLEKRNGVADLDWLLLRLERQNAGNKR